MSYHRCRWVSDHATSSGSILRSRGLVFGAALLMLVAGCSSQSSSSQPTPQFQCTPGPVNLGETAPPPHDCDRQAYEKDQERLKLEKQALDLFKNFSLKYHHEMVKGGSETLPPQLEEYLADPAKGSVQRLLAKQKQVGGTVRGEDPKVTMRVIPNPHQDGSEVALKTCTDLRRSAMYRPDGTKLNDGLVNVETQLLKRYPDGRMRLFYSDGEEEDSCPFE